MRKTGNFNVPPSREPGETATAVQEPIRNRQPKPARKKNPLDLPLEMLDLADIKERVEIAKAGWRSIRGFAPNAVNLSRMVFSPVPTDKLAAMYNLSPKWAQYDALTGKAEDIGETVGMLGKRFAKNAARSIKGELQGKTLVGTKFERKADTGVMPVGAYKMLYEPHIKWANKLAGDIYEGKHEDEGWLKQALLSNPDIGFMKEGAEIGGKYLTDPQYRINAWRNPKTMLVDGIYIAGSVLMLLGLKDVGSKGIKGLEKSLDDGAIRDIITKADNLKPSVKKAVINALVMPVTGLPTAGGGKISRAHKEILDDLAKKVPEVNDLVKQVKSVIRAHEKANKLLFPEMGGKTVDEYAESAARAMEETELSIKGKKELDEIVSKVKSGGYDKAIKGGKISALDAASEIKAAGGKIPKSIQNKLIKEYGKYMGKGVKTERFIDDLIQNRPPRPFEPEVVTKARKKVDIKEPEAAEIVARPKMGQQVWHYLASREGEVVAKTSTGKKILQFANQARDVSARRFGKASGEINKITQGMDKATKDEVVQILDKHLGRMSDMPPYKQMPAWVSQYSKEAVDAAISVRKSLESVRQEAVGAGMKVGEIEAYFPHYYPKEMFEDNSFIDTLAKRIAKTDNISYSKALNKIEEIRKHKKSGVMGHLEMPRKYDVPGYTTDLEGVLNTYYQGAFRRIEEAKAFGPKGEIREELLGSVFKEGGDYYYGKTKKFLDDFIGKLDSNELARQGLYAPLQRFTVITKMGLSSIANASQPINNVLVSDLRSMIQGIGDDIFKHADAKTYAHEVGATIDTAARQILRGAEKGPGSWSEKFLKWTGFTAVENHNRVLSSAVGKHYTKNAFKRLLKKGKIVGEDGRRLTEFYGEDKLNKMLKRGSITEEDIAFGAKKFSDKTQFKSDKMDLPGVMNTPGGRLVFQLKSFAYNQTKLIFNTVGKEAAHGNLRPLLAFLTMFPIAGEVTHDIYTLITKAPWDDDEGVIAGLNKARVEDSESKEVFDWFRYLNKRNGNPIPEKSFAYMERAVNNVLFVGGLGMVTAAYEAAKFGEKGIYNLLIGPNLSTIADFGIGIQKLVSGEPETAVKYAERQVPIVGPMAARQTDINNQGKVSYYSRGELLDRKEQQRLEREKKTNEGRVKELYLSGDEALAEKMAKYYGLDMDENKAKTWFLEQNTNPRINEILHSSLSRDKKLEFARKVLPEATEAAKASDDILAEYKTMTDDNGWDDNDRYNMRIDIRDGLYEMAVDLSKRKGKAGKAWGYIAEGLEIRNEQLADLEVGPSSEGGKEIQQDFMDGALEVMQDYPELVSEYRLLPASIWDK